MNLSKDFFLYLATYLSGITTLLIFELMKKYLWSEKPKGDSGESYKFKQSVVVIVLISVVILLLYVGTSETSITLTGFDTSSTATKSIYNNMGYNWYTMREYDKAIEFYEKAIEEDPNYALALNNKALAEKDFAKARNL